MLIDGNLKELNQNFDQINMQCEHYKEMVNQQSENIGKTKEKYFEISNIILNFQESSLHMSEIAKETNQLINELLQLNSSFKMI